MPRHSKYFVRFQHTEECFKTLLLLNEKQDRSRHKYIAEVMFTDCLRAVPASERHEAGDTEIKLRSFFKTNRSGL
jgi:hypothetical protein